MTYCVCSSEFFLHSYIFLILLPFFNYLNLLLFRSTAKCHYDVLIPIFCMHMKSLSTSLYCFKSYSCSYNDHFRTDEKYFIDNAHTPLARPQEPKF